MLKDRTSFLLLLMLSLTLLLAACGDNTPTTAPAVTTAAGATVSGATSSPNAATTGNASATSPAGPATTQTGSTTSPAGPATTAAGVTASSSLDWKKYSGKSIRFIAIQGPWIDAVKPQIAKFEQATGIKVNLEVYPEAQSYDKIQIELKGNSDTLDVFFNQTTRFGDQFVANNWYEPLEKYVQNPALTAQDFNFPGDFPAPSVNGVTFGGKVIGIPLDRDQGPIMSYRQDLLEQYNIPVPKTLADLEAAAKKITEATGGSVKGIVNRGKGAQATSQFAPVLQEFGGRWQDAQGNPAIDTPEAQAAFDWWGRTLRLYGPQGVASFDFPEVINEFLSGKAAFSLEGAINPGVVNNPQKSQVVGKVGYSLIPSGPGGDKVRQNTPCKVSRMFGLSLSAFSKNKEAGWLFIEWMSGKAAQTDYLLAGRIAARNSAWSSQEFQEKSKSDKPYWDAADQASKICYPTPGFAPESLKDQGRARDIIGQVITTSILGGDVKTAETQAQQELVSLKARQ